MAKVLLVEDDNNLREIYEARLAAEGYDISSAQDGEEALVVAKQTKPDLVVSDVMMPKISGFEMLDILRNTPGLEHVKVIMLTALGQSEDRDRADSLGADKYLVKSQVTLEDIVKTAHELLGDDEVPAAAAEPTPVAVAAPADSVATPPAEPEAVAPAPEPAQPVPAPSEPTDSPVSTTDDSATATADDDALAQAAAELTGSDPQSTPVAAPEQATPTPSSDQLAGSTAEEQAEVSEQINSFVQEPVAPAPVTEPEPEAPSTDATADATAADDQIMANAVTELADSTEPVEEPAAEPAETPAVQPEPATQTVTPDVSASPAAEDTKEEAQKTNISISGKKTIQPLDSVAKPDINELLAREEAAAGNPVTGAAVISTGAEGQTEPTTTDISATPTIVHQPGQSFAPQQTSESTASPEPASDEDVPSGGPAPAPSDKDKFDPNSIAL